MRITYIGHAGLFIETKAGSILCDPWFTPAYFGSWFPFPSNEDLDLQMIARPDYLYVSHLHHDHFDPAFLAAHVDKNATVLLPKYPMPHLRTALADLGFHRFVQVPNAEPVELDGLRLLLMALVAPTDGPIGDSGLCVDDGSARMFNQNDSRPVDIDTLAAFGPYDGHFLQFSGAIWYPMVYDFAPGMIRTLGHKKRKNELTRASRYVTEIGARFVFPFAGPPAFLDEDLYRFNDLDRDPSNIFPDQTVFLEHLEATGVTGGRLMIPGSTITLDHATDAVVRHPLPDGEVAAIYTEKASYLKAYQQRWSGWLAAERASWPDHQVDLVAELQAWWEPLLSDAPLTRAGINGRVLIHVGDEGVLIDFPAGRVGPWQGEDVTYRFDIDRGLVEACILRREGDWVNELFLSCRFRAHREGPYNEYVYNFFKSLSSERMAFVEGYYAETSAGGEFVRFDEWVVQRRCPHLKADLARFGEVEGDVLTCRMHGWQFELSTGRCLTSDDRRLDARRADGDPELAAAAVVASATPPEPATPPTGASNSGDPLLRAARDGRG